MDNQIYGNSKPEDKRLIDALDTLLWTLKNPSKVDLVWRLKAFESVEENLLYSKYATTQNTK